MEKDKDFLDFGQVNFSNYIDVILQRKLVFIIALIVPLVIGSAFTLTKKTNYRAASRLEINAGVRMPLADKVYKDNGGSFSYTYMDKQVEIMKGVTISTRVKEFLSQKYGKPVKNLPQVSVRIENKKTNIVDATVDCDDKEYAIDYLDCLIKEFFKFKMELSDKSSNFALMSLSKEAGILNDKINNIQQRIHDYKQQNNDTILEESGNFSSAYLLKMENRISDLKTQKLLIAHQIKAIEKSDNPAFWISIVEQMQKDVVTPALTDDSRTDVPVRRAGTIPTHGPNDQRTGGGGYPPAGAQIYSGNKGNSNADAGASRVQALPFVFVMDKDKNKNWARLKARYETTQSELSRAVNLYKPKHPKRIQLEQDLISVKEEMKSEIQFLLDKYKARYESIRVEEEVLTSEISGWQNTVLDSSKKVNELMSLNEEEERLKLLYRTLTARIEEINVSDDYGKETVLVLEEPRVTAIPLKTPRKLFVVFVFSVIAACCVVFLLDYLDDTVKTPEDLKKLDIPALGIVQSVPWDEKNLVAHNILSDESEDLVESYRTIRTNILLSKPESTLRTLLVTSALPSEGKTTTSVNTSMVLAQNGFKVLLIDGDLRRPTIHKMFGFKNDKGFSTVLSEIEKFDNCVVHTRVPGLDVLSAGHIVPDPAKLLHAANFKGFIEGALHRYDKVVIDSAPILTVSDSVMLSDSIDSIMLVVHGQKTSKNVILKTKEALMNNSSKIIGAVLNNIVLKKAGYYYYNYRYKYKYGYGSKKTVTKNNTNDKKPEYSNV